MLDPKTWTREEIERHSLDMRQFIDFRQATLPNGMRIIEAYNASGLTFTLLPDRGLDIWTAHYKGIPLTWISPGSPHPPDFGQSWLRQFNGGLLTTCGLTHVGPPETDEITGEQRDLHGNYTRLRAQNISVDWGLDNWSETPDFNRFELKLSGAVYESSLFGHQLRLDRTIWQSLQLPDIGLSDVVTNIGDKPAPLMLLYHINLGYPLIRAGAKLHTAYEKVYPRDPAARAGFDSWATYEGAAPGYAERVYFHHVKRSGQAMSKLLLTNAEEDFGILLTWDTIEVPYLTQWKNTRQGIYVCGIEPGNCIPEGQNAARRNGRLVMLEPGQRVRTYWAMDIKEGAKEIAVWKDWIQASQRDDEPVPNCKLDDYAHI